MGFWVLRLGHGIGGWQFSPCFHSPLKIESEKGVGDCPLIHTSPANSNQIGFSVVLGPGSWWRHPVIFYPCQEGEGEAARAQDRHRKRNRRSLARGTGRRGIIAWR